MGCLLRTSRQIFLVLLGVLIHRLIIGFEAILEKILTMSGYITPHPLPSVDKKKVYILHVGKSRNKALIIIILRKLYKISTPFCCDILISRVLLTYKIALLIL